METTSLSNGTRYYVMAVTPTRLYSFTGIGSLQETCSMCLTKMKQGCGHAIFSAKCSHSFHFHCIASNVKHSNQICPLCREKSKEIPIQGPSFDPPPGRAAINPIGCLRMI